MKVVPGEIPTRKLHQFLLGSVSPRPICFASTVNEKGEPNLSPFSFFNVFGSNPATLIFSPSRRVRNNTLKDTLHNVKANGEVVINMVSYSMVQQVSLASCEYPESVDEFIKSGFTKLPSEMIRPFRVAESPVQIECKVRDVIETGTGGGAGNLVICEVLMMHINEEILDADGMIDPHKIDLVARMGKDFYCRASGNAVFEVHKPNVELGIGFEQLPVAIRKSRFLTGNQLGMLANVTAIPDPDPAFTDERVKQIMQYDSNNPLIMEEELHKYAGSILDSGEVAKAWQVLLMGEV